MTLKEFRNQTKDLPEYTVMTFINGKASNYIEVHAVYEPILGQDYWASFDKRERHPLKESHNNIIVII